MNSDDFLTQDAGGDLIFRLRVQPGAKETAFVGLYQGVPKIKLRAAPVDGRANKALISFLSDFLDLPKSRFELIRGQKDRNKTIRISRLSIEKIEPRLKKILSSG